MKCKLLIQDHVNCLFVGISAKDMQHLSSIFAFKHPNSRFDIRVKLGKWDGAIRFFSKTGTTYVNLLDEIIPIIDKMGYDVELIDRRQGVIVAPDLVDDQYYADTDSSVVLRPYQVEAINAVLPYGNGIIRAATGAGKTITIATLANCYGKQGYRALVIVPTIELVEQTIEQGFAICGLDAGAYFGLSKELDNQYVVATWQSLINNPHVVQQFQTLIIDEVQSAKGASLKKLAQEFGKHIPIRFGFTGTIPKEAVDRYTIISSVGPQRYEITAKTLQDRGYLSTVHINLMTLSENLRTEYQQFCEEHNMKITYKQFKKEYFPDYQSEKSYLYKKKERQQFIADFASQLAQSPKGNTLILVDRRDYADQLCNLIEGAVFIRREDDMDERQAVYKRFEDEDHVIVVSTIQLIGTGLNIQRIFNIIALDCSKSYVKIVQMVGRGLRKSGDKDHLSMFDISSDLKYSTQHRKTRMEFYDEEQFPHEATVLDYGDYQ